jgi:hypothetical protein
MRRDLERRVLAVETRWYGSPRLAAILRRIEVMSDEELLQQMAEPAGILDPATLSDSDLDGLSTNSAGWWQASRMGDL